MCRYDTCKQVRQDSQVGNPYCCNLIITQKNTKWYVYIVSTSYNNYVHIVSLFVYHHPAEHKCGEVGTLPRCHCSTICSLPFLGETQMTLIHLVKKRTRNARTSTKQLTFCVPRTSTIYHLCMIIRKKDLTSSLLSAKWQLTGRNYILIRVYFRGLI